jgi:hypothetical protein
MLKFLCRFSAFFYFLCSWKLLSMQLHVTMIPRTVTLYSGTGILHILYNNSHAFNPFLQNVFLSIYDFPRSCQFSCYTHTLFKQTMWGQKAIPVYTLTSEVPILIYTYNVLWGFWFVHLEACKGMSMTGSLAQVIEHLLSMCETLNSMPSKPPPPCKKGMFWHFNFHFSNY